jgi:hypothetical protein
MKKYILSLLLLLSALKASETPIDFLPNAESVNTNIGVDSSINESPEVANRSLGRFRARANFNRPYQTRGYAQSLERQNNSRGDRQNKLRRSRNDRQNSQQALVEASIE